MSHSLNQSFSLSDVQLIASVSSEYLSAPPNPFHDSWKWFISETVNQFIEMRGYYSFERTSDVPYDSSQVMFDDLDRNARLKVFTGGNVFTLGHPLSFDAFIDEERWNLNHIFRAVHDIYGHYRVYTPFETFQGELAAYRSHRKLYSSRAIPALFSETVGQLCSYYGTGKHIPIQYPAIIEVREL